MLAGGGLLGAGDLVDEVDDALVGDTAVGFQTHLAGAAVAVAHLDAVVFQLFTQLAQCPAVDLGMSPATIAGKAAASHALGQEDNKLVLTMAFPPNPKKSHSNPVDLHHRDISFS